MKFKLKDYNLANASHGFKSSPRDLSSHTVDFNSLRSHTVDLNAWSALTYPPAGSVCTHKSSCELNLQSQIRVWAHKSMYGLKNPCMGSQIRVWPQKSMRGLTNLRESGSILMILATRSRYFLFRNYYIFFIAHYLTI